MMPHRRLCLGSVSSLSFEEDENDFAHESSHGSLDHSHDDAVGSEHRHEPHDLLTANLEEQVRRASCSFIPLCSKVCPKCRNVTLRAKKVTLVAPLLGLKSLL